MKKSIRATATKYVVPKVFAQLTEVERAIKNSTKTNDTETQLTLLVKLDGANYADIGRYEEKNNKLESYLKALLGPNTEFGFFYNREIGTIFVAGSLSEQFLHDIDGKKIGELSEGPYGILRGLGISAPEATDAVKRLGKGKYLLLVRGNRFAQNDFEAIWDKTG
ncbi:hypothetical protein [Maribacter sp. ACAM166]|uniref:hypothetical protein n=1 Tax=Maribacter sp. ACAM166 TaxID=2508996 RepID=UPI0010FE5F58|nr:hypothetical protein [Maribacter sp. ACAM166]